MSHQAVANLPLCKYRYVLMVSYMGTKYYGSQRLVNRDKTGVQNTIQEAIEVALESVFPRTKCRLTASSRTDRGVHALMNCYSLPLMDYKVPTDKLKRLVNHNLIKRNHEIILNEVLLAPAEFHPRRAAISREYIYKVGVPRSSGSVSRFKAVTSSPEELLQAFQAPDLFRILPVPKLDLDKVEEAANLLRGEHDFASFSFQPSENDNTVRELEINVTPANELTFDRERSNSAEIFHLHFKSHAFLHNQVRRLVGAILSYATFDAANLSDIKKLLDNPDSKSWNPKMPIAEPWGLYLSRLNYPKSAFEGAKKTYESESEEEVDLNSIPGLIDVADDQVGKNDHNTTDATTTAAAAAAATEAPGAIKEV